MMRQAIVLDGIEPVNVIILADGPDGDVLLSETCVEITDLDLKPGLGIGWTYVNGAFLPAPLPPLTWDDIRRERGSLLASSDWTQLADNALAAPDIAAWAAYRQQLRDIPQDYNDPDLVVWPEKP